MLRLSMGAILPPFRLIPVPAYTLCHKKPIFDLDYYGKRSYTPNNMSSRKRSNTYWTSNTFALSLAICITRTICHRVGAATRIARPICLSRRQQYVLPEQCLCSSAVLTDHYVIAVEQQYVLVNQYVIQNLQQHAFVTV